MGCAMARLSVVFVATVGIVVVAEVLFHFRLPTTSSYCLQWQPHRSWDAAAVEPAADDHADLEQPLPPRTPGPHVLILTPVKDAAKYLDMYFRNIRNLTFPHDHISIALLDDDEGRNGSTWKRYPGLPLTPNSSMLCCLLSAMVSLLLVGSVVTVGVGCVSPTCVWWRGLGGSDGRWSAIVCRLCSLRARLPQLRSEFRRVQVFARHFKGFAGAHSARHSMYVAGGGGGGGCCIVG